MKKDNSHYFPASVYLKEVKIDFEDLPKSIVSKWVVPLFDNILLTEEGGFSYESWLQEVRKSISFTSRKIQTKALVKGIEFAKKAYDYHLKNECPISGCWNLHESWERRIVLAENLLDEIESNQIVKIDIVKESGADLQRELKESLDAFQEPIKALLASPEIQQRMEEMAQNLKIQKADYEKTWDSLKHYLQGKNYILPKDTKDFFYWFFTEKVGHLSPYESSQTKISDNDFIEYSNWREANMKHTKSGHRPIAANFSFINEPLPTIEQSVQSLLQEAYNTTGKTSHDIEWSIEVVHTIKTRVLFGNELTNAQQEKYEKQLNLIENILQEKRQKAKEREIQEDEYRISQGLEPKYKVSPAVLDHIIKKITEDDNLLASHGANEVTIADRILRELEIIQTLFQAQKYQYCPDANFLPILDKHGKSGIDGKYIAALDIFSDVELFNLQFYKRHFTERFESTSNLLLLTNQLIDIQEKAEKVKAYYDQYLSSTSQLFQDYIENKNILPAKEGIDLFEEHSAVVTISRYHFMELYFGANRSQLPTGMTLEHSFTYTCYNEILAEICQSLIDFICQLTTEKPKHKEVQGSIEKPDALGYAILHYYWQKFSNDKSKAITKLNVENWSRKYGISKGELLKKVKDLETKYNFEPMSSHHSIRQFAKQYKLIMPLLKKECEPAFKEVENRLKRLKAQNPSYFIEK